MQPNDSVQNQDNQNNFQNQTSPQSSNFSRAKDLSLSPVFPNKTVDQTHLSSDASQLGDLPKRPWARKKRTKFFIFFSLTVLFVLALFAFKIYYKKPTCFDGKLNGNEIMVDCGGACEILCIDQVKPLAVAWVLVGQIDSGRSFVSARVSNPNSNAEIKYLPYVFKIYRGQSVVQTLFSQTTFLPNEDKILYAQFAGAEDGLRAEISLGENNIAQKNPIFYTISNKKIYYNIRETNDKRESTDLADKISFDLENSSVADYGNINIFIILYDKDGAPYQVSKTFVPNLPALSNKPIFFTFARGTFEQMKNYEIIIGR